MKKLLVILALVPILLQSQKYVDCMGMPTEFNSQTLNAAKFDGDDFPISSTIILKSFASPSSLPTGITCDSEYLYLIGYNEYKIYKINPFNGTVVETIAIDIQRPYGIDYFDGKLYVLDNNNNTITVMNTDGTVIETIDLSVNYNPGYFTGLSVFDGTFWINDTQSPSAIIEGDSTINFNLSTNTLVSGFPSYGNFPTGIVNDGDYLWVTDNFTQSTYKISLVDYSIADRIQAPGGMYPNGLSISEVGLWYVNNASDSIYLVELNTTNNEEISLLENISVYPNPTTEFINVSWTEDIREMTLFIYDMSGKLQVQKTVINNEKIDLGPLNKGIFIVQLFDNGIKKSIEKIVVI